MPLTVKASFALVAKLTKALDLTTPTSDVNIRKAFDLVTGAGVGQADLIWTDTRTVASAATDTIDVAGALTSGLGDAISFARLKSVLLIHNPANTTQLSLTRPAANGVPLFAAASDALPIPAGGFNWWYTPSAAGIAVTAGTGDLIDIVNSAGASATYDIVLIGSST